MFGFIVLLIILVVVSAIYLRFAPQLGGRWTSVDIARMEGSEAYQDGRFHNSDPAPIRMVDRSPGDSRLDFFKGRKERLPQSPIHTVFPDVERMIAAPSTGMSVTWFGHSTAIIEIEGLMLLTDPVFVPRPSPLPGLGPKAFPGSLAIRTDELPNFDAILISHDHYDHLDRRSILALVDSTDTIIVPLGVKAHLRRWKIPENKIVELDWWQSHEVRNGIKLTATPAQHFSGRNPFEQNRTLWAGWAIRGSSHSIFFGGDSGYSTEFSVIGDRCGPFDITMLDSAQYSIYWPAIHMHPHEVVKAHQDLGGDVLLPIHWGKFNLSLHHWTEPIERVLAEAEVTGVHVATPLIGETFRFGDPVPENTWWRG